MSSAPDRPPFQRSPELRAAVALAVAGVALLLALLEVAERRSRLLMLDLREWRPAASAPLPGWRERFAALQAPRPEQRPFRLTLQLDPAARPGDVLAAEREIPVDPAARYCFRALTFATAPAPAFPGPAVTSVARVLVDGAPISSTVVPQMAAGGSVYAGGLRPRGERMTLRFEVRAEPGAPPPGAPAAVHLELATLRECSP